MKICVYANCKSSACKERVFCKEHAKQNKDRASRRARRLESKGLCIACGLRKPELGRKCCRNCNNKRSVSFRLEQARRKSGGICLRCGKNLVTYGLTCAKCRINRRNYRNRADFFLKRARYAFSSTSGENKGVSSVEFASFLKKLWAYQKGLCPLSGRKLSKNKNTELDHIIPRSKGGKTEIGNVRFLHKDVNQALRSLTDKVFIKLCEDVVIQARGFNGIV